MNCEKNCHCCPVCSDIIDQQLTMLFEIYGQMKEYLPELVHKKINDIFMDSKQINVGRTIVTSQQEALMQGRILPKRRKMRTRENTISQRIKFTKQIMEGVKNGATIDQMCRKIQCSHRSFQRWREMLPEWEKSLQQEKNIMSRNKPENITRPQNNDKYSESLSAKSVSLKQIPMQQEHSEEDIYFEEK